MKGFNLFPVQWAISRTKPKIFETLMSLFIYEKKIASQNVGSFFLFCTMACHVFKSRFQEYFHSDINTTIVGIDFPRNPTISHSNSARQFNQSDNSSQTLLRKSNSLPTRILEQKTVVVAPTATTTTTTTIISVANSSRLLFTEKTNACSLKRRNHIRRKKKILHRQRSCNSNSSSSHSSHNTSN